jgi:hypothetical protein
MKQVILDTTKVRNPQEVFALLHREGLESGDSIRVLERPLFDEQAREALFLLALMAVLWYMNRERKNAAFATELLDDVFGKYNNAEDLEKELHLEFDISVTTEMLPPSEWPRMTMRTYEQAAYADDEPDISHIALREPNPAYEPWKKDE